MSGVSISIGPCEICAKPAGLQIGFMTCESCATGFDKLCERCAAKPCPKCKGLLEATERVFPHSLFQAISKGAEREVERLLRGRPEPLGDLKNRTGETALALAARFKTPDVAKSMCEALLRAGFSTHAKSDNTERTALITMVEHRRFHKDVAELLQSSINDQDVSGKTALMFAAEGAGLFGSRRGNGGIARTLLALGADPQICDKRGQTALGHAIASNDTGQNEGVVDLIKDAILNSVARREFVSRNSYHFDNLGNLEFAPR
jgi:ankyrin repeat protein